MNLQQAIEWRSKNKLFVSLAARPGKTGETFYNTLFKYHNIDAEYVACVCTDLAEDMKLVRAHCAGASITMPFKSQAKQFVDSSTSTTQTVNTIVNTDGVLTAHNCDFLGLVDAVGQNFKGKHVVILGDGAMAENVRLLCQDAIITQASRKSDTWHLRHTSCDVLINTTSVGMNPDESPVNYINANTVVDCVIGNTPLINKANAMGAHTISGAAIYIAQFMHQFKYYTNQQPDQGVVDVVAKQLFNYD